MERKPTDYEPKYITQQAKSKSQGPINKICRFFGHLLPVCFRKCFKGYRVGNNWPRDQGFNDKADFENLKKIYL